MVVPLAASANTGPFALGFQPVGTPLGTSTAARLLRKTPPRLVKLPPTKTLLVPAPSDKANTEALATLGFHAVAFPVAGSSAAIRLRAAPPIEPKSPPTYTTDALTAMARTGVCPRQFGPVRSPVVGSKDTNPSRNCAPTLEKIPPAWTLLPATASARTSPLTLAFQPARAWPVSASSAATSIRLCPPAEVKCPPT